MGHKYSQYSVEDFDKFDCLKLSKTIYLVLIFVLRGYLVWLMSVTNMQDRVGIIQWLYPQTALFYLSLASGAVGLFVLLVISLRRAEAKNWVRASWPYCRVLLICALVFDFIISLFGFFYWQLLSVSWLVMQGGIIAVLIYFCFRSRRMAINLQEFPEKLPE
ncbi:DUF2919 domain-containing protein [Thalassomonas viridans]|uniref:DUF2919 domain-containing protein n=1 Tax=Thalassomonas viridans TaxID=137584 RepID=A0AAF0CAX6_9GAMM|nr:DUF2919 family protein [Thalassomonas viridans]WDE07333.1 DUF2919 domain-containing protein [Thalassomonas viridans]